MGRIDGPIAPSGDSRGRPMAGRIAAICQPFCTVRFCPPVCGGRTPTGEVADPRAQVARIDELANASGGGTKVLRVAVSTFPTATGEASRRTDG